MSAVTLFPLFMLIAMMIAIPIILGIFVFTDAKKREMHAPFWALVSAIVPALIGFVIYLLARTHHADLRCPHCGKPIRKTFAVCPACAAKLRSVCPACAMSVERDWNVCPRCATPLPKEQTNIEPPTPARDRTVWRVLCVVLLIPTLLITLLVLGLSSAFSAGSSSFTVTTIGDYYEETDSVETEQNVRAWLSSFNFHDGCAYALRYEHANENNKQHFYLIYIPGADDNIEIEQASSIFGTTITVHCQNRGNKGYLLHIVSSADQAPKLKIDRDGEKIPCKITSVDYNPTTYYIVPNYSEADPNASDFFLPERISVVHLVANENVGVSEITDRDTALHLLVEIDSAPYLDIDHDIYGNQDGSGGYDFHNGFDIIIEYRIHDSHFLHEDMLHCLVMEQNGKYYVIDDRADHGRFIRETDEEFYNTLKTMFEASLS